MVTYYPRFACLIWLSVFSSITVVASSSSSIPVPIVIWHGLGDRCDSPGLLSLKADLESRKDLTGVFVHLVGLEESGTADQRASFFGDANHQVDLVCQQLAALPQITSARLNPSGKFDAVGFSQGGQLLRAVVERCTNRHGLMVRNLITVGSQHMGISAFPPCPPGSSPLSFCRLMHFSLIREGVYSTFAQKNIVPAQYFRDESRINDYMQVNTFLKDINNELEGDEQGGPPTLAESSSSSFEVSPYEDTQRNATYKRNLASIENLVLLRFSDDSTVVPPQSAHFTVPSPKASNCPTPPSPNDPVCYLDPVPFKDLPLYYRDYIGLRLLNEAGKVKKGICVGQHMEINSDCWEGIVSWLGIGDGEKFKPRLLVQS